jgi:signal transduction histidine kinase
VEGPDQLPPLPAAVEVAAYRIAQEAVNNAAQHGEAQQCWVRLKVDDGLTLEIIDDGSGLPDDLRVGVGITSMRERTSELGGRITIETLPEGGTRVHAWMPITGEGG